MGNQFIFEGKQKTLLLIFMSVGLLSLGITYFTDDELHTRFWSNILHNSVFFTGIAFMALFIMSAKFLAYSGWHIVFKRLWEAYSLFLIVGIVLMAIVTLGVWGHLHHLYHWADEASVAEDVLLQGKASFLNAGWYTVVSIGVVGVWYLFATRLRNLSLSEDQDPGVDYSKHRKRRN